MLDNVVVPAPYTPVADISGLVDKVRATFHSRKTTPIEYRKQQLRKLWWGIKDNEQNILDALKTDLRKSAHETVMSEITWLLNDIINMINNLDKYAADEKLDIEWTYWVNNPIIRKDPLGVILVIGAFNYPFQLTLGPLIGVIAGGNTAIIKPSEVCVASCAVMMKIVRESLDQDAYNIINGGIPETTEALKQKYDKICYTGNGMVGRIVAAAAAKNLTPTLLELGGLNPAIVTKNADIKLTAKRLAWGKLLNAGQICISPDYALVPSSLETDFVKSFKDNLDKFFPDGTQKSDDLTRIVNERHFKRIKKLLDDSKGEIKVGGNTDETDKFIDVTLVKVDSESDSLLSDEIFGPVFPYMVVDDLDEAIAIANRVSDTPLALYAFSKDQKETDKILRNTRSGGASVNDAIWHGAIGSIPFGGVGESGTGSYRGKYSFDAFVHRRTMVVQPSWIEGLLAVRYPPYFPKKLEQYRSMTEKKPNFDRAGAVRSSWLGWLFTLGGSSKYVLAVAGAVYLKMYIDKKRALA